RVALRAYRASRRERPSRAVAPRHSSGRRSAPRFDVRRARPPRGTRSPPRRRGTTLLARSDDVGAIEAKLRVPQLQDRRGLTELEEAWLVRSLYRDDRLGQPEIARRMSRHKSWVWRRLMLVESLEPAVQAHV